MDIPPVGVAQRSAPLRVLHVLDHSWPVLDGYAQRSRSIIAAQAQLGMQPSVVTSSLHESDDPSSSDVSLDGISYFRTHADAGIARYAIRRRWPVAREMSIVRLLRRRIELLLATHKFDVIHAHSPALCGLAAWQAARRHDLPFVYEIRSFWEDSDLNQHKSLPKRLRYQATRSLETFVVSRADAIVGIARSILNDLESRDIPSSKLYHVPNGVDIDRFTPTARDAALASDLGVIGVPTLGFLGTLFPWEGVPWLVAAASELHRKGMKFKLLIVGDGAEAPEVRRVIQALGAYPYISFLGRIPNDQVERYYSVMDVLVYPRRSVRITELVTALKPLEAMALGKAVLASSVGGMRELIEPGTTGVLFKPNDTEDFCKQAFRLLQEPELRSGLGSHAREKMLAEKDWKILARRYESVYEAAIRNSSARS